MYQQIVVGSDGSEGAAIAVDAAIDQARLCGAVLHVVHAHKMMSSYHLAAAAEVGVMPINIDESNEAIRAYGQRICDQVVERAEQAGVTTKSHCVTGDPVDALIDVAKQSGADLIVVGNRGMTGARRFVLGSVPNKLSHHCPTNLLIVDTSQARG